MEFFKTYRPRERGFNQQYTDHLKSRTTIGDWFLKHVILPHTIRLTKGLVVDFGCGVGELLALCPEGSLGLEINQTSVSHCVARGLNAQVYAPDEDDYNFAGLPSNRYQTFLMSHVLEHIPDTAFALRKILRSCQRLNFSRVIVKVPGYRMYQRDKTHVTFVNRKFLAENQLMAEGGFKVTRIEYFPINLSWIGHVSPIDEMIIVYDRG